MLVDTSVLARTLQPRHPTREIVRTAIKKLTAQGHELSIVPQNLIELWVVATRPVAQSGFGLSTSEAAAEIQRFQNMFEVLPDSPAIYGV